MSIDLTQILLNASSQDLARRGPAEAQLRQLQDSNLAIFLSGLCTELANQQKPPQVRQLAGLLLKNCLSAKSEQNQRLLAQNWLLLPQDVRSQIRELLLRTLSDSIKDIRSTAALVIGKIASIEVPQNLWPNVIEQLCQNITQNSADETKEASLQALGYVCEECPDKLHSKSNLILTSIASGMHASQKNNAIKLAATRALENSLEFAKRNFDVERERNQIVQMILETAMSNDENVRVASFQCLVKVASMYYVYLKPYMQHIFRLTGNAIANEKEPVALQAIEFWSTIAETEKQLHEDADVNDKVVVYDFAKQAVSPLIPLILNNLLKQTEDIDHDTWNVAMASGSNLLLMAQAVGDPIVSLVVQFVQAHLKHKDWRHREAATLAFGCILEGPDKKVLTNLVVQAFPIILSYLKDDSPLVKDTAAWTIGRICELVPETITQEMLPQLMNALALGLKSEPKVASNVCWAIHNLAEAVEVEEGVETSALSKYFPGLLEALLQTADRDDSGDSNLLPSAYEAISVLVQTAAPDVYPHISKLMPTLVERLKKTFLMQGLTAQEKERQNEVQALLCGSLQSIVQKMDPGVIRPSADTLMAVFLQVLNSKNSTVHEETFMAVGAVANKTEGDFIKYMNYLRPFLLVGLRNYQEVQVCTVAVGVIGDVARALGKKLAPCDDIVQLLLQHLQNRDVDRSIITAVISCLGDIATAIGGHFDRYLPFAILMLSQVSALAFQSGDDETNDFAITLRESILEAYIGIVQGLTDDDKAPLLSQFLQNIVQFLVNLVRDQYGDDAVLEKAIELLGDLITCLREHAKPLLGLQEIQKLVADACSSGTESIHTAGETVSSLIERLKQLNA